ncbi:carboxylate-amine ligase, partial [bacterium]|nr:carboxylate-amine ligase [bacterium]
NYIILYNGKIEMKKQLENLTLGIEEEYQLIDPKTKELTSYITEILEDGEVIFRDEVKPELLQSQIEVGSKVCNNLEELELDLSRLRKLVKSYANKNNLDIVAAGTHPFSHWKDQIVTDKERYHGFMDSTQYVGKRMLIFGMHVHIGIKSKDLRIDIMNQMRYFMPHILALSTSSPFWQGNITGFKSFRSIIFEDLPRTGIPEVFTSYKDYESYLKTLIKCNTIDEPTKIWWDIRPHSLYPTLEFRICDCPTRMMDALSIAALIQALVAKLIILRNSNQSWRDYRGSLIHENKWRATKDGINSKLLDLGKVKEVPYEKLMIEMLDFVDEVVDQLGSRRHINHIKEILKEGTSADKQIQIFKSSGDIKQVVDHLISETARDI